MRYNWLPYINLPFNPFSTNIPLLYLLKTSENWRFSDIFRGYRSESLVENGLRMRLAGKIPDYGDVTKYNWLFHRDKTYIITETLVPDKKLPKCIKMKCDENMKFVQFYNLWLFKPNCIGKKPLNSTELFIS